MDDISKEDMLHFLVDNRYKASEIMKEQEYREALALVNITSEEVVQRVLDGQLRKDLNKFNVDVGQIDDTTRELYVNKLDALDQTKTAKSLLIFFDGTNENITTKLGLFALGLFVCYSAFTYNNYYVSTIQSANLVFPCIFIIFLTVCIVNYITTSDVDGDMATTGFLCLLISTILVFQFLKHALDEI